MRFSAILLIGLVMFMSMNLASADNLFDNDHHTIVGHIYEPYDDDNTVTLINVQTGEQLTVTAIKCEHGLMEYQFDLANLHDGWNNGDKITITYGDNTRAITIDDSLTKIQVDLNAPFGYTPIIISGAVLITGGAYYYIRKRKNNDEVTTMEEPVKEEPTGIKLFRDFGVRALLATLLILGFIACVIIAVYLDNADMIKDIAVVYSSAIMAVIVFYFDNRVKSA